MNHTSLVSLLRTFSDSILLTSPNPSDFESQTEDVNQRGNLISLQEQTPDHDMDEAWDSCNDDLSCTNTEENDLEASSSSHCQGNHSDLRKKIMAIQTDSSIPANEKSKRIQELMSSKWNDKQREETQSDGGILNLLKDKEKTFAVWCQSIKRFHTTPQQFWVVNTISEELNFKPTAVEIGMSADFATMKCLITQSQGELVYTNYIETSFPKCYV